MKNGFDFVAESLGIVYDKSVGAVHGSVNGISVVMVAPAGFAIPQRILYVTVAKDGQCITEEHKSRLQSLHKAVDRVSCAGKTITVYTKDIALGKPRTVKGQAKLEAQFIEQLTALIAELGYINACDKCDATENISLCLVDNELSYLCQHHFDLAKQTYYDTKGSVPPPKGSLPAGLLGAFIGCLVGVILIAILGAVGFMASIGGIVLAVGAIKGYELLGKNMSKVGLVLTIIMMIVMVYFAQMLSYSIYLAVEFSAPFDQIFLGLHNMVFSEPEIIASYYGELAMLYLFTLIGAIQPIRVASRNISFKPCCKQLTL